MQGEIRFQQEGSPGEFVARLPAAVRRALPPGARGILRRYQLDRLRANIQVLRAKQMEFNCRIASYVRHLEHLIRGLEEADGCEAAPGEPVPRTRVKCQRCLEEKVFPEVRVILPGGPDGGSLAPADLLVLEGRALRRGRFVCPRCGADHITVQTL